MVRILDIFFFHTLLCGEYGICRTEECYISRQRNLNTGTSEYESCALCVSVSMLVSIFIAYVHVTSTELQVRIDASWEVQTGNDVTTIQSQILVE